MRKLKYILFIVLFIGITPSLNAQDWTQIGSDIDGEAAYDFFGKSVSLSSDGSVVAIGAYGNDDNGDFAGQVCIYENQSGTWTQIGSDINGEAAGDYAGFSVNLSSDGLVVAIGAKYNYGNNGKAGHVRIFENQSGLWTQIGDDIDGEATDDESGYSVSLSSEGSVVAIGAKFNNGNGTKAGHVRIYENQSGTWAQIGSDIDGEAVGDRAGFSVSLSSDGSVVAIGAPYNDNSNRGNVRIYKNQSGTWTQIGSDIDGEAASDLSGWDVSLSSNGSIVAIGAVYNGGNGDFQSGHVRIFENQSGTWTQIGSDMNGEAEYDQSGFSVSLSSDGSIVAIGAIYNDGSSNNAGHVRIYENQLGTWTQLGSDIVGEAADDLSGCSVSLSSDGSIVAIGAPYNEGNGRYAGHVRIYTLNTYATIKPIVCNSYTVPSGDETYTTSGVYHDTIPNVLGNDSIIVIDLTIANNTGTDVITAYDSYTWIDGNTYTLSNNTATHTLTNINGCDSVVTLDLTLNYSNIETDVITSCDSYTWIDGNTYTSNNNTATHTLININGGDSIVALDLTLNYSNTGTDVISVCDSYTWIDGNTYTLSNNTASHTLTNVNGCDSLVTLDLTINSKDVTYLFDTICEGESIQLGYATCSGSGLFGITLSNQFGCDSLVYLDLYVNSVDVSVSKNVNILTANNSTADEYQWLDCNRNDSLIAGEISQSYTATENGNFAVIVDNGLCVDTSLCYTITGVWINEIENASINIYPNPTNGIIEIDLADNKIHKISITDISGNIIIERIPVTQNEKIDLLNFESGLYFIRFETDKGIYTSKIIKE